MVRVAYRTTLGARCALVVFLAQPTLQVVRELLRARLRRRMSRRLLG
jgi:hypothetical protein